MDKKVFIVGANGQLGHALQIQYPHAQKADIDELDITNEISVNNFDWSNIEVILNAAAYTNVDGAETDEGRVTAWQVNAEAVKYLSAVAKKHAITLVHISTDYVFDGSKPIHSEVEAFSPLSVYGSSKAAGDLLVSQLDKYYIFRTSWVIGEGKNFVRTMLELGKKGVSPTVVSDQVGRPTFTSELVRAIDYVLTTSPPAGTFNVSNDGEIISWANFARVIFKEAGYDDVAVTDTTTKDYYKDKTGVASRPLQSTLSLEKLQSTGFSFTDWRSSLASYIEKEMET